MYFLTALIVLSYDMLVVNRIKEPYTHTRFRLSDSPVFTSANISLELSHLWEFFQVHV